MPSRFNDSTDQYTLALDSLPSEDVVFTTLLTATSPCDYVEGSLEPVAYAKKSSLTFGPGSLRKHKNYIIQGTPGCYDVTSKATGDGSAVYESVTSSVILRSHKSNAVAPRMTSARFSRNPRIVVVNFDSLTDKGINSGAVTKPSAAFPCTAIFYDFDGSSSSKCLWNTNKAERVDTVLIFLSRRGDSGGLNMVVGTQLELRPNKIRPCKACCPISNVFMRIELCL